MGVGYTFKPFSYTKEHVNCTKLENPYERKNIIILYFSRGTTVKTFCISSCFFLLWQEALGHTCAVEAFRLQPAGVQALIETPLTVPASAKEGGKVWTQLLMGPQTWLVFPPSPNPSAGCLLPPKASGCCCEIV